MEYEITGKSFPIVRMKLQKGETVKTESGGMTYMSSGITMDTNTSGGIMKGLGRVLSGDTFFLTHYTAETDYEEIAFSAAFPGRIIPYELNGSNTLIAQKNAFLVAENDVDLDIFLQKTLGAGIFGGEGFVLQKLSGKGTAFLEISGDIIERELQPGERIRVDPGHVAALQETVEFDIERVKGAKNMLFGGEGIFFATLTGPGKVWLQSMPLSRLAEALIPYMPTKE